jgi:hypothetical protein
VGFSSSEIDRAHANPHRLKPAPLGSIGLKTFLKMIIVFFFQQVSEFLLDFRGAHS